MKSTLVLTSSAHGFEDVPERAVKKITKTLSDLCRSYVEEAIASAHLVDVSVYSEKEESARGWKYIRLVSFYLDGLLVTLKEDTDGHFFEEFQKAKSKKSSRYYSLLGMIANGVILRQLPTYFLTFPGRNNFTITSFYKASI